MEILVAAAAAAAAAAVASENPLAKSVEAQALVEGQCEQEEEAALESLAWASASEASARSSLAFAAETRWGPPETAAAAIGPAAAVAHSECQVHSLE